MATKSEIQLEHIRDTLQKCLDYVNAMIKARDSIVYVKVSDIETLSGAHEKKMKLAKVKKCVTCGKEFQPRSNRQAKCSEACGMKPQWKPKAYKESTSSVVSEVERIRSEREKQPYVFGS